MMRATSRSGRSQPHTINCATILSCHHLRLHCCACLLCLNVLYGLAPMVSCSCMLSVLPRFALMIGTREHTEHLWRITKDQNQHSHIAQEPLLG